MLRSLPIAVLALCAACASEEGLFSRAPRNRPVKIIVLEVEGSRATLVATEGTLADIRRMPGVLEAERGSGRNEVRCLVEERVEPQDLMSGLAPRYRVKILRTVRREDPPAE